MQRRYKNRDWLYGYMAGLDEARHRYQTCMEEQCGDDATTKMHMTVEINDMVAACEEILKNHNDDPPSA